MKDWNSITVDRYYDQLNLPNRVGVGILDVSRDISSSFVCNRTFDMTYFYINRMLKMGLSSYIGVSTSVKTLLEAADNKDKDFCMIACQGLMLFRGPSLIEQSLNYAKDNPEFFVIGHIMDKATQKDLPTDDTYPGLHRQYLFVNVKKWKELGSPEFDELGVYWDRKPSLCNFNMSTDTVHSEYTPAWIDGVEGSTKYFSTSDGANWIDIACKNNIRIDNLTTDMRDCKVFLYPYSNSKTLELAWKNRDKSTIDSIDNQSQRAWLRKMAYQEYIEKDRVYAFNTETLSSEGERSPGPIDVLVSPAAGFKPLAILSANRFHKDTIVHYFDWCNASLDFKKHLLETWNGVDLHKWLIEHDLKYNFSSTYRGNYERFWLQEVAEHGGPTAFKELWDRYSELEHHFHVIDIVTKPKELFDIIDSEQGTKVLWTTNIWSSEMLHWNVPPEEVEKYWLKFEEMVPDDLILYGHDYIGVDMRTRIRNGNSTTHPRFK